MDKREGLCFRCEHRANFLETGRQPRCECGSAFAFSYLSQQYRWALERKFSESTIKKKMAVIDAFSDFCVDEGAMLPQAKRTCYMYDPVRPVVLKKNKDALNRPQFAGGRMSARSTFVRTPELQVAVKKFKDGNMLYYLPKEPAVKKVRKKKA